MIVFLKNTVTQINVETQKGKAPVVRAQQTADRAGSREQNPSPEGVDAVTGGTQGISHYFAAQGQVQVPTPDSDET